MLKTIGAIFAGFLTVFILSIVTDVLLEGLHIFPAVNTKAAASWWILLVALLYRSFYAVIGGYVTAWLSTERPMKNVTILGIIGFVFATLGLLINLDKPGLWYPILLVILTIPSVLLGGKLRNKS